MSRLRPTRDQIETEQRRLEAIARGANGWEGMATYLAEIRIARRLLTEAGFSNGTGTPIIEQVQEAIETAKRLGHEAP